MVVFRARPPAAASPTWGAKRKGHLLVSFFFCLLNWFRPKTYVCQPPLADFNLWRRRPLPVAGGGSRRKSKVRSRREGAPSPTGVRLYFTSYGRWESIQCFIILSNQQIYLVRVQLGEPKRKEQVKRPAFSFCFLMLVSNQQPMYVSCHWRTLILKNCHFYRQNYLAVLCLNHKFTYYKGLLY